MQAVFQDSVQCCTADTCKVVSQRQLLLLRTSPPLIGLIASPAWYVLAHSSGDDSLLLKLRSIWRMLSVLMTVVMPNRFA